MILQKKGKDTTNFATHFCHENFDISRDTGNSILVITRFKVCSIP